MVEKHIFEFKARTSHSRSDTENHTTPIHHHYIIVENMYMHYIPIRSTYHVAVPNVFNNY